MHRELVQGIEYLALIPRGEMAVVADVDSDDESDDDMADTIRDPRVVPLVPPVRIAEGGESTPSDEDESEDVAEEDLAG
jgi:hypothetical protein